MNTRNMALILTFIGLGLLGSCSRQPSQDYVVTGTLSLTPEMQSRFESFQRSNIGLELIMTARSSPKSEDILIQRRWTYLTMPFEFGMGKGRTEHFLKKTKSVYVTAVLRAKSSQFPFNLASFTVKPVPIGTYHIDLLLNDDPDSPETLSKEGAPVGGWISTTIIEEAIPPGLEVKPIGPMAFAGTISAPEGLGQSFRGWKLQIVARERVDRGAPELILTVMSPVFPYEYSLHQFHRVMGGNELITDPKYVVILLDRDGSVETKNDRVEVASAQQVEIGATNLNFRLPESRLRELLGLGKKSTAATSQPTKKATSAKTAAKGELVASGVVDLPEELVSAAKGATLWIIIRDPETKQPMMFKRFKGMKFPFKFEISNGEGTMGMGVRPNQRIIVKATLTPSGEPTDTKSMTGYSSEVVTGAEGLKITLARP